MHHVCRTQHGTLTLPARAMGQKQHSSNGIDPLMISPVRFSAAAVNHGNESTLRQACTGCYRPTHAARGSQWSVMGYECRACRHIQPKAGITFSPTYSADFHTHNAAAAAIDCVHLLAGAQTISHGQSTCYRLSKHVLWQKQATQVPSEMLASANGAARLLHQSFTTCTLMRCCRSCLHVLYNHAFCGVLQHIPFKTPLAFLRRQGDGFQQVSKLIMFSKHSQALRCLSAPPEQ